MANIHWVLSEFLLKKFNVLVSSDDHFDFQTTHVDHYANVSLVVHFELPRTTTRNVQKIWGLRNSKIYKASKQTTIKIVTFFREESKSDLHFKAIIEKPGKTSIFDAVTHSMSSTNSPKYESSNNFIS
jgi:hypothetical protein